MRIHALIKLTGALAGSATVSAVVAAAALSRLGQPHVVDVRAQQTPERYALATRYYAPRLAPTAAALIDHHRSPGTRAVVLVLREHDIETCEDLGRQLREFRRAIGEARPIIVLGGPGRVPDIEKFLGNEHVAGVTVLSTDLDHLYVGDVRIPTPAMLLVNSRDSVIQGVAHPLRFPDARVRSFAEELTDLSGGSTGKE